MNNIRISNRKRECVMFETDIWVILSGASLLWSTGWSVVKILKQVK